MKLIRRVLFYSAVASCAVVVFSAGCVLLLLDRRKAA
jgi:hypothetical protein